MSQLEGELALLKAVMSEKEAELLKRESVFTEELETLRKNLKSRQLSCHWCQYERVCIRPFTVERILDTVNSLMFARDLFGEFRDHL